MNRTDKSIIPRQLAVGIYVAATLTTIIALVVNMTGLWGWDVDGTTFALIGVLLLIPVAERLRKFKVGKYFEAEFAEKVENELDHLGRWVSGLNELATTPPEENAPEVATAAAAAGGAKTIRRIVWVDDEPDGNRLEIAELSRRFIVVTATSTKAGLAKISNPEETAIISDAVRVEAGETNHQAGVDLIEAVKESYPAIPVYVYCGQSTVDEHAEPLELAGARIVTASFAELTRVVRADARATFEAEVATILAAHGEVESQPNGLDFVLVGDVGRIGVKAKDYRRTPKRVPLDAAVGLLGASVDKGEIDEGWLIAPRDAFIDTQRERVPDGVRLLSIEQLPHLLRERASRN